MTIVNYFARDYNAVARACKSFARISNEPPPPRRGILEKFDLRPYSQRVAQKPHTRSLLSLCLLLSAFRRNYYMFVSQLQHEWRDSSPAYLG